MRVRVGPDAASARPRRPEAPYGAVVRTPLGVLGLILREGYLTGIDYLASDWTDVSRPAAEARDVIRELEAYFRHPGHRFSIPVAPRGTPFQKRVWQALQGTVAGETLSYGELARRLDTSARAIGGACRSNPIPIVIPCHRVVAAYGLGGYSGPGTEALGCKRWLIAHERRALG